MIETSRRKGSGLDFILSNIALASYANSAEHRGI